MKTQEIKDEMARFEQANMTDTAAYKQLKADLAKREADEAKQAEKEAKIRADLVAKFDKTRAVVKAHRGILMNLQTAFQDKYKDTKFKFDLVDKSDMGWEYEDKDEETGEVKIKRRWWSVTDAFPVQIQCSHPSFGSNVFTIELNGAYDSRSGSWSKSSRIGAVIHLNMEYRIKDKAGLKPTKYTALDSESKIEKTCTKIKDRCDTAIQYATSIVEANRAQNQSQHIHEQFAQEVLGGMGFKAAAGYGKRDYMKDEVWVDYSTRDRYGRGHRSYEVKLEPRNEKGSTIGPNATFRLDMEKPTCQMVVNINGLTTEDACDLYQYIAKFRKEHKYKEPKPTETSEAPASK